MPEKESEVSEDASDSFSINDDKTLVQWRFELKSLPKRHWNVFYGHFLGHSISNYARFFRALKLYGDMNVFEAVLATAAQSVDGDPLNYVLKVTHSMWREKQVEIEKEQEYNLQTQAAIEMSRKQNKELAAKIKKIKR